MAKPKRKDIEAFVQAVSSGAVKTVKALLEAGMPVDVRGKDGATALILAIKSDRRKTFEVLLECGADPNAADKDGVTPLHWAIRANSPRMVQKLLEHGADVNAPHGNDRETPLMAAVGFAEPRLVKMLVQAGADPNARKTTDGGTALMEAVSMLVVYPLDGPIVKMIRLLLRAGAHVQAQNTYGQTALDLAQILLDDSQRPKVERLLRGAGARPDQDAEAGARGLLGAAEVGDLRTLRKLLADGVPADVRDSETRTALMIAAEHGQAEALEVLLRAGADLHAVTRSGYDLLNFAAYGNDVGLVKFLLGQGLPVDGHVKPRDPIAGHATPLISAAIAGHVEVARVLLEAGANPDARLSIRSVLGWAREEGHREVVALLRETGTRDPAEDPALAEVDRFKANAQEHTYNEIVERLTALCGRPKRWQPDEDHGIQAAAVYRFTLRNLSRLAEHFGRSGRPTPQRDLGELLDRLGDEVRGAGYQLLAEAWPSGKGATLVLFPTSDKYAVIAAIGTDGINWGVQTADVIDWLRHMEKRNPFELTCCGSDFVGGKFAKPVAGAKRLARGMADFCPDTLDPSCQTVEELARTLKDSGSFLLWWD